MEKAKVIFSLIVERLWGLAYLLFELDFLELVLVEPPSPSEPSATGETNNYTVNLNYNDNWVTEIQRVETIQQDL